MNIIAVRPSYLRLNLIGKPPNSTQVHRSAYKFTSWLKDKKKQTEEIRANIRLTQLKTRLPKVPM
jgi:hypothetical protein